MNTWKRGIALLLCLLLCLGVLPGTAWGEQNRDEEVLGDENEYWLYKQEKGQVKDDENESSLEIKKMREADELQATWNNYKRVVDAINSKNPYTQIQISRYSDRNFTNRTTGLCNVSSITTLLNRRLAYDNKDGQIFTVLNVLTSNSCTNITYSGTKYYFDGNTGNWWSILYKNSNRTQYYAKKIPASTVKQTVKNKNEFDVYLANLLYTHPEGICVRNKTANHVFVIYFFEVSGSNYQFYVKDPVHNYSGKFEGSYMYSKCSGDLYTNLDAISYLDGSASQLR